MSSDTSFSALSCITSKVLSRVKMNILGRYFWNCTSQSAENEILRFQSSPYQSDPVIGSPVISDTPVAWKLWEPTNIVHQLRRREPLVLFCLASSEDTNYHSKVSSKSQVSCHLYHLNFHFSDPFSATREVLGILFQSCHTVTVQLSVNVNYNKQ